ncbi:helix-turn-helix domain-containing protein [Gracilibacillus salitolerans]|uniref:Helix-turn-helix domain-containing protein n=1 Tax=Gracilibacillus salitolerans TaxID=2663022 RepID=A0A5Q2TPH2_9BACI|nr:AraC family transcriptional regulator [Gracilibacillus salitolerans]QGH36051.1 helix-turn-helix domain-containing protein [Gracilibacillus salitolerans]
MEFKNLTPYIRVAMDSKIKPPFYINRSIFDYELIFLKEGEILLAVEDNSYHCVPGDIIFLKPMQHHMLKSINENTIYQPHIHFDFFHREDSKDVKVSFKKMHEMTPKENSWFREDITKQVNIDISPVIRLKNPIIIENLLFDIINEFDQKLPYYEVTIQGLFSQLWGYIQREIHWQKNTQIQKYWEEIQHVKAYINHHHAREVTLEELEKVANISKYHLVRLFKMTYRVTPIKYHLQIRIEKAKELIQYSELSINEIAERFGFNSIHAFSRSFKNMEGVPPSFYRKSSKE